MPFKMGPGCKCCIAVCTGGIVGNVTYSGCGTTSPLNGGTVTVTRTSTGATVATTTTNSSGNYTVALPTPVSTGSGDYTVTVTATGFTTQTSTVTIPCNGTLTKNFTTPANGYTLRFITRSNCTTFSGITPNPCPAPNITVTAKTVGGAVLGTATSDNTGTALIAVPAGTSNTINWTTSSGDYGTATGTTNCLFSADPTQGCLCTFAIIQLNINANHYCYGGVQPPGATGALPGTLQVTIPNDPSTFGSLAGTTKSCALTSGTGTQANWQSTCMPVSGIGVFTVRAQLTVSLQEGNCGLYVPANTTTTGIVIFNTFTNTTCSGSPGQTFSGTTKSQPIWNPMAFTCTSGAAFSVTE